MNISVRPYNHPADVEKVGRFLVRTYCTGADHVINDRDIELQ